MCTEHVHGSMDVTEHVQGSMDVYRACTGQHGCVPVISNSTHVNCLIVRGSMYRRPFLRSMNTPIACFLLSVAFDSSSINSITACDVDIALRKPY